MIGLGLLLTVTCPVFCIESGESALAPRVAQKKPHRVSTFPMRYHGCDHVPHGESQLVLLSGGLYRCARVLV